MDDKNRLEEVKKTFGEKFIHSDIKWLIEQAEKLEKIKVIAYAEHITISETYKKIINIFEDKEDESRIARS